MEEIKYHSIGIIRSPFQHPSEMPIQPTGASGILGSVELFPEFAAGVQDLEGFSHLILIYHFHRSQGFSLTVTPFLDEQTRGVFATRAPRRPNAIGLSVVRLVSVVGTTLTIERVDVLDRTPLLDLKPYVPEFDSVPAEKIGWLTGKAGQAGQRKADSRFS